jgi:molybdopterin-guanine dinucleotide biosynthesis protein
VVFGATGSGKTVLCKGIVEELSLRGIPILAINPKGDIGALTIRSEAFEFRPFSDSEAEAKSLQTSMRVN